MNKKIMAIAIAILLSSTGVVTIALAQQKQEFTEEVETIPDIWPVPRPRYPKITVAQGVGLNKVSMETESVVFVKIELDKITPTIQLLPGDVDRDCDVDSDDLNLFIASYGKYRGEPGYNSNADFNNNGKVDYEDLLILAKNYGKSCPIPVPPPEPETINYLIVGNDLYPMTKIYERYDWDTKTKIYKYKTDDGSVMTAIVQQYSPRIASAEFKNYLIAFEPLFEDRPRVTTGVAIPYPGPMEKVSEEIGINIQNIQAGPIAEWLE